MILNPLTNQIKLYLIGIATVLLLGGLGYSHYWMYKAGQHSEQGQSLQALTKALKDQETSFRKQREAEMREASELYNQLIKNEQKKVKQLTTLNEITRQAALETSKFNCLVEPVNPAVISLLNDSRGEFTTEGT